MALFFLLSFTGLVVSLLLIGMFLHLSLVVVTVENVSMAPTLKHGDRVLVMRYWPGKWLRTGQIVLVRPQHHTLGRPSLFEAKPYIKRIVGLGGEIPWAAPSYGSATTPHPQSGADQQPALPDSPIPPGHLFVLGDNRDSSLDSRSWGPLPLSSVLGVVLMKLPRKIGTPPAPSPEALSRLLAQSRGLPVGQDAPPFTAQTLSGAVATLASYRGRTVVFLFITPSKFCRKVIPAYEALVPGAARAGVTLLCVSGTSVQTTQPFVDELHMKLPVLVAPRASNTFFRDYCVNGTPFYCFVNEQGKVESTGYPTVESRAWGTLVESWTEEESIVSRDSD